MLTPISETKKTDLKPYDQEYFAAEDDMTIANTELDTSSDSNLDLKTYEQPVLGRAVFLGDLYNAKNNEILTGYSFWNMTTIRAMKERSNSRSSNLKLISAETTLDRLSQMDIDASLELDFLGELFISKSL